MNATPATLGALAVLRSVRGPRRLVLLAVGGLFALWLALHARQLTATQNGGIRFSLTFLLGALIFLRPKPLPAGGANGSRRRLRAVLIGAGAAAGAAGMIAGLVFRVHQLEWVGLLTLCLACLAWALPRVLLPDLVRALCLLYWAHPLPARLFGPFQLSMQQLSVRGSEWLLHVFNVRAWADGLVLQTTRTVCEVPDWCSGMRTATTVFLLGAGLAMLHRLGWRRGPILVALAVAQGLLLNIVRITLVTVLTPALAGSTSAALLHNTTGVVVLASVLTLYAELVLWQRARRRRAERLEAAMHVHDRIFDEHPPVWQRIRMHRRKVLTLLLAAAAAAVLAYKSRPSHRLEMVRGVALALIDTGDYASARQAIEHVLEREPDDTEWKLTRLRVLLAGGNYADVLGALDEVPDAGAGNETMKNILRAYSLMGLDRLEEAAGIVGRLPERLRRHDPRAAMVLAELAVRSGRPREAAAHVMTASRWPPNVPRLRALYPYLREHNAWDAIAESDTGPSSTRPEDLFAVTEAYMHLNRVTLVADRVIKALERWPDDPRLLEPLFFLTLRKGNREWEQRFASHLKRVADRSTDADEVYGLIERCFELLRPDLAWHVMRRLHALDAAHPGMFLATARYGGQWFLFRTAHLGLATVQPGDTVDLSPYYLAGRAIFPWLPVCRNIPLGLELAGPGTDALRRRSLRRALAAFRVRDEAGQLSLPMQYEFVRALDMNGDLEGVRGRLDHIVRRWPEQGPRATVMLSELYEAKDDWPNVYETLRTHVMSPDVELPALLRMGRAQQELNLGLAVLDTGRRAVRRHPRSALALALLAEATLRYDSAERTLQVLARPRVWHQRRLDVAEYEALLATRRLVEAENFRRRVVLPRAQPAAEGKQPLALPPAELTRLYHRIQLPSERDFRATARLIESALPRQTVPFLADMHRLWLQVYRDAGRGPAAAPARWEAAGRDHLEQAVALHQLALLLCRSEQFESAREAAGRAVAAAPHCAPLWRLLVSLAEGDPTVIAQARQHCPDDAELWLAELVAVTHQRQTAAGGDGPQPEAGAPPPPPPPAWRLTPADAAAFTAAPLARAGDFLLRTGQVAEACRAARAAMASARGLLPAFVLGMTCALTVQDRDWALDATRQAIAASSSPSREFYRRLVMLKRQGALIDTDQEMVDALQVLRREDPDNPLWAEMLGYIRFRRGGWETVDALAQMTAAIRLGAHRVETYLMAAESARLLANHDRAADILRQALKRYPQDMRLRNNLALALSATLDGRQEAMRLAEQVAEQAPEHPDVLDTAALCFLRGRQWDRAEGYTRRLKTAAGNGTRLAVRAGIYEAEIALRRGNPGQAIDMLNALLDQSRLLTDRDVLQLNDLLAEAKVAETRRKPEP